MTLRLLDVKYYVLLPETEVIGGNRDHYQWTSVLYALSTSLPSDNSLHISSGLLQVINRGIGGILFMISAYILPALSRAASEWAVGGQVWLSGHLITATRSVITLLVPMCVVITMNQDCFAKVNII